MKIILSLFSVLFFAQISYSGVLELNTKNIDPKNAELIKSFLSDIESRLPKNVLQKLSDQKVIVQFSNLDNEGKILIPNCSNVVDSISEAKGVTAQFAAVKGKNSGVRYNKQIQSITNKNTITLNSSFIDVILGGESRAQGYACDQKNTYKLAQASVINGIARIFDGEKTKNKSSKISDQLEYKFIAGWNKKKLQHAFWPRALNPYEYAGDTEDHFASNMEFFLLDPEYACRRPLLQSYLSKVTGSDPFLGKRNCEVNTELLIPSNYSESSVDEVTGQTVDITKTELKTYNLDPSKVYNVYYMKASAGNGIGGFGHSMFRVVVCPPNMSISKECEKMIDRDLVFNPRANANEMRLDNMRGLFGGYPSQFLVNTVDDLREEYGDNELRHLFNMPLGYTNEAGQFIDVMPEDQKKKFIWAALESYWAYYGNYKFISNNCADEAMRLYQMTSTDERVLDLGVLKPNDVNKKLHKLGYIDETEIRQYEKNPGIIAKIFGAGKIKSQKEYDERRKAIEAARYENTFVSKVFGIEDAVRGIMALEGNPNPDFKVARKEIKKWLNLATPDYKWADEDAKAGIENLSEEQRAEILSSSFFQIKSRYEALLNKAQTQKEKDIVVFYFYRLMFHIYNKRAEQVGNKAIQTAYAVAYPSKDRSVKEMPKNVAISKEQYDSIRSAVDVYSEIQAQLMPYREASVQLGYGIPLKNEVVRGDNYIALKEQESEKVKDVIVALAGLLGPEHVLLQEIGTFYEELRDLRLSRASQLQ